MRNLVNVIGSAATGGVSTLLAVEQRAWEQVIFQQGKKPVDAEFNLLQQLIGERQRLMLKNLFGSGLAGIATAATGPGSNVVTIHNGANLLPFLVDGRIVLAGDPASSNKLQAQLSAPPGSGTRTDLVFLEVWYAEVQPAGSPETASSAVYTNGGLANATLSNDLVVIDGAESTRRIQMRYRVRVVDNVVQGTYPNGMNDPQVLGRGDAGAPVATYTFTQDSVDTGVWTAGDGTLTKAQALKCVDGYVYAVPICFVSRAVGVTTIPTSAISMIARVATATNADMVDGFHANATPTAGMLLPLDGTAKFPATVIPSTINADKVDSFDAFATPTASQLLALDSSGKFPNSVLKTGTGQALDADMVDSFHAAASPAANILLALDSGAKFPNSALKTGSGNGLDADSVDGYHAAASPSANILLALDSGAKFPNSALKTGSGNGLDADSVDGFHGTTLAGAAAYASKILSLDSGGKFPNSALKTGSGNGLDADLLDGLHAAGFAASIHSHAVAAGVSGSTGFISVSCGNSYTTVQTQAITVANSGYHLVSASVRIDAGTAASTQWQMAVFVDGVEDPTWHQIMDTVRSPVLGWRSSGGLVNMGAGAHTITIRVKAITGSHTVTVGWARVGVTGPSVS